MKQGKNPTKRQKIHIKSYGLNPDNWPIYKADGDVYSLIHRNTSNTRKIPK
jgi:hypothetical protein